MDIVQKVTQIIEPTLTDMGFLLVRVLFQGADTNNTLQIMVERADYSAMQADDCEKISRSLSAVLDVDLILASGAARHRPAHLPDPRQRSRATPACSSA